MAKKRRGHSGAWRSLAGAAWAATEWLVTGLLHLFYLFVLALLHLASLALGLLVHFLSLAYARLFVKTSAPTASSEKPSARPHVKPQYQPLIVQKSESGLLASFENKILSSQSTIGLVVGARGSGKSALGMRLLENIVAKTDRKVCAMGFSESSIPGWIMCVSSVDEVPNGSFVLVDEGGISFSSRSSMSSANQLLSSLLFISRHKDISVLFITQNSANLELNAIRQADYLLLRKPSLLQRGLERKEIGRIYTKIGEKFGLPSAARWTYIYSDEFTGFVSNALPSFWNAGVSKPLADLRLKSS